jgi:hypothetical protein
MGWSIDITSDTLPDPQETISGVSDCPGNFYTGVTQMKDKQLRHMEADEAYAALVDLIAELDKGDKGLFSNVWAEEADGFWSKGRETREEYSRWTDIFRGRGGIPAHMPFSDYTSFCGYTIRERMRKDAVRFALYYKAGYTITFEW